MHVTMSYTAIVLHRHGLVFTCVVDMREAVLLLFSLKGDESHFLGL